MQKCVSESYDRGLRKSRFAMIGSCLALSIAWQWSKNESRCVAELVMIVGAWFTLGTDMEVSK